MKKIPGVSAVILMVLVLILVPVLDVIFLTTDTVTSSDRIGEMILILSMGALNIVSLAFVGSVLKFFHFTHTKDKKRDMCRK